MQPFMVDMVSDPVCPWCFLGLRRLRLALAEAGFGDQHQPVSLRWHPFLLNPALPREGMDRAAYLTEKFGQDTSHITAMQEKLTSLGEAVGIRFDFAAIAHQPNTVPAHILMNLAASSGDATAMAESLFGAYFERGLDIGDREVLLALAEEHGLAADDAGAALDDPRQWELVNSQTAALSGQGVEGVPFFVLGGHLAVGGAQEPATLVQALNQAREQLAAQQDRIAEEGGQP